MIPIWLGLVKVSRLARRRCWWCAHLVQRFTKLTIRPDWPAGWWPRNGSVLCPLRVNAYRINCNDVVDLISARPMGSLEGYF